jgi:hypothetical protein
MMHWLAILIVMLPLAMAHAQIDEPLLFGGCGGVYLLAEPGELSIDIVKRGQPNELRAVLVGPDRRVIDDQRVEGHGTATFTTTVPLRGVYAVNITVAEDRYGTKGVWGVRTNCDRYVIETARGHKDERHQEPIVLRSPGRAGDICFAPIDGPIAIDLTELNSEATLFNGDDEIIAAISPIDGVASYTVAPDVPRDGLWRLHLSDAAAVINIDGLTRWQRGDPNANQCVWTPLAGAWFAHMDNRWLITPYNVTVHGETGDNVRATFTIHNHAPRTRTINLPGQSVTLEPYADRDVTITATVPSQTPVTAAPADDPTFSTYATLIAKPGPAARQVDMPLTLRPYEHENQQFGYLPDVPLDWEMHFDLNNRPSRRVAGGVYTRRDDDWELARFTDRSLGAPISDTKIAFDADNDMYLVGTNDGRAILQHSTDGGRTFTAYDIGDAGAMEIENFAGHNMPADPPPVVRSIRTARDPKLRWRSLNTLDLIIVDKVDGHLVTREPLRLSDKSLGVSSHSGIPSIVVSRGSKVHIVWAEATDPDEQVPGVPTFVVTYDREKGALDGEPALIGYGAPPNDVHNRPCIVLDSKGYLHALTGTHGAPFQYARSLEPNTAHAGWTEAQTVGEGLSQTYIGMVCDPDDTLHVMFRLWRRGIEPHPKSHHAQLAYQRKRPGEPWEPPRPLVISPFSEYSVFYHRLNIDQQGRLFLSYDYWSTFWFYRNDHRGNRRSLIMSSDGGESWKLVTTADLR